MIFTSLTFILFFGLLLTAFILLRGNRARQNLLLVASYIFYGAWNPAYLLLIAACSLWSWGLGFGIYHAASKARRLGYLWVSLGLSLGALGYFKYAGFFVENTALLFDLPSITPLEILLPVGISFFTFQAMSYSIDLYRGRIEPCTSLRRFLLYIAFFPQLVAGPIVRATEFLPQLERPLRLERQNVIVGSQIFLAGMAQKLLVADQLAPFVDSLFAQPLLYDSVTLWLGLVSYTIQIFCDFSGYSLMAIGSARILGFHLPENFRMPYLSRSIAEFWRRWHMSLSFWMRDYVYISLGGNRTGPVRTYVNLAATMLFTGLWHGASWNFVFWGAAHGIGLIIHRLWRQSRPVQDSATLIGQFVGWALTLLFVMLLWIPFRAPDFTTAYLYLSGLFGPSGKVSWLSPTALLLLTAVIMWHLLWLRARIQNWTLFPIAEPWRPLPAIVLFSAMLAIILFAPIGATPFIYFRF